MNWRKRMDIGAALDMGNSLKALAKKKQDTTVVHGFRDLIRQ